MGDGEGSLDDLLGGVGGLDEWTSAQEQEPQEAPAVVRFRTASGAAYAVEGELVREVLGWSEPASLPGAPDHILGIVLHRRQVIGLLDLELWLGGASMARPHTGSGRIVVVESAPFVVGLPAAAVNSVELWPRQAPVGSPQALRNGKLAQYTREIRVIDDELVAWLDVRRLLEDAAVRG